MGEMAALLGAASSAGGAIIGTLGAKYEGEATKAASVYNARVAMAQARANAEKIRADAARARGKNIVNVAKSGVRMEGSALSVLTQNAFDSEKQALNVMRAGRAASNLYRMEGKQALIASRFKMASSALSGLSGIGGSASSLGAIGGGGAGAGGGG